MVPGLKANQLRVLDALDTAEGPETVRQLQDVLDNGEERPSYDAVNTAVESLWRNGLAEHRGYGARNARQFVITALGRKEAIERRRQRAARRRQVVG